MDSCVEILKQWPTSENGFIRRRLAAREHLKALRTDLDDSRSKEAVIGYTIHPNIRNYSTNMAPVFSLETE
jgi:hypothetical protein